MPRVVLPIAPVEVVEHSPAVRPESLAGGTIGFLDGWGARMPDGSYEMFPLMAAINGQAESLWRTTHHIWRRKARAGSPASVEDLDAMKACDAVICGTCLSGGCTAGAIDDATALEAAGIPTVTLCQANFEELARAYARARGFPHLKLFLYPVPAGGNFAEDPYALVSSHRDVLSDLMFDDFAEAPTR